MYRLRKYVYKGHNIGEVNNPAIQPDGIYIHMNPKTHINPDELEIMVMCLLDGYEYKIGTGGELWIKLPRNTKYGPILNGIARAYYELQTGKREPAEGQTQLPKEAAE